MMVKQTRLVFEADDIAAVKIRCRACTSEVTADLDRLQNVTICPACQTTWQSPTERSAVWETLRALRRLTQDTCAKHTITFEIDIDPEDPKI